MASLQYVIDSICSSVSEKFMYQLIEGQLGKGSFTVDEVLPLIQGKDRSLDSGSARMLAEAAIEEMAERGDLTTENEHIYPVK
ncbi:hypothetical protein ACFLUP_00715 [Chloroflexota bacterium]